MSEEHVPDSGLVTRVIGVAAGITSAVDRYYADPDQPP
jgi:hypothetical protein